MAKVKVSKGATKGVDATGRQPGVASPSSVSILERGSGGGVVVCPNCGAENSSMDAEEGECAVCGSPLYVGMPTYDTEPIPRRGGYTPAAGGHAPDSGHAGSVVVAPKEEAPKKKNAVLAVSLVVIVIALVVIAIVAVFAIGGQGGNSSTTSQSSSQSSGQTAGSNASNNSEQEAANEQQQQAAKEAAEQRQNFDTANSYWDNGKWDASKYESALTYYKKLPEGYTADGISVSDRIKAIEGNRWALNLAGTYSSDSCSYESIFTDATMRADYSQQDRKASGHVWVELDDSGAATFNLYVVYPFVRDGDMTGASVPIGHYYAEGDVVADSLPCSIVYTESEGVDGTVEITLNEDGTLSYYGNMYASTSEYDATYTVEGTLTK